MTATNYSITINGLNAKQYKALKALMGDNTPSEISAPTAKKAATKRSKKIATPAIAKTEPAKKPIAFEVYTDANFGNTSVRFEVKPPKKYIDAMRALKGKYKVDDYKLHIGHWYFNNKSLSQQNVYDAIMNA